MRITTILSELKSRLSGIRRDMFEQAIDSLLISGRANKVYLTGRENGTAVIDSDNAILWLKDLYITQHEKLYLHRDYPFEIREYKKNAVIDYLKNRGLTLSVENISMNSYKGLRDNLRNKPIVSDIVESRRMIKSDYEIDMLKKSADIAKEGMEKAYELVREGVMEAAAAAEIESVIRKRGSEAPPFGEGILLASGSSGADIHAKPALKRIRNNSLVIVDLGAKYNYYFSDMTRTIPVGGIGKEEEKAFEFIKNLEKETIDNLGVGVTAGDVHKSVEDALNKEGYRFYHSTGHGVGLDVHELPNISPDSETVLCEGMVFTIEPGIYVPNRFGVRFEDTLVMKRGGIEVITG